MAHDNLMLIAQLSGLRILALANRLGCDSDLASDVHDRLAGKLAEMIDGQRKILAGEHVLTAARGTGDEEDAALDLYYYQTSFAEAWHIEPVTLLDDYLIDGFTREFFNFRTGSWHFCEGVLPIVVPVDADKLCGLTEIIAQIEDASGVRFSIEHVYYSEEEAEAAWWKSSGQNPETFFASAGGTLA